MISNLLILATEGGIPTSNPWSQLAVPLGILIFVGSVYMLIRSNLGTRRGYLVMSASLWGFTFLLSLFWTFGAPGTPANVGPQNLPGQELDEYQPIFVPFAADSEVATAEDSPYAAALDFPNGWGEVPADFQGTAEIGVQNISSFFAGLDTAGEVPGTYFPILDGTEELAAPAVYAVADNSRPMIGATFVNTCQLGVGQDANGDDVAEDALPPYCEGLQIGDPIPADAVDAAGEPVRQEQTLFALFDAGTPSFPSLLMTGILFVLFAVHMVLLARDERREARETLAERNENEEVEVEERATVGV